MKYLTTFLFFLVSFLHLTSPLIGEELFLRDNLQLAQPGDYIVISCYKTETLMHIRKNAQGILTIEEITIPESQHVPNLNWKAWVEQGAPKNTSWVMYDLNLKTGQMVRYYSFTKQNWFDIPDADNFLCKLLNLRFTRIPEQARKRIGPKPTSGPELRPIWQPRMIVEGKTIPGVEFDAWRSKWPRDGGDLSGKTIEIYLPTHAQNYFAYFPYWLQVNGAVGKAKIRLIDSGKNFHSNQGYPNTP